MSTGGTITNRTTKVELELKTLGIGNLEIQKFLLQEAMSGQRKTVARGDYIGRQKDYTDTPQP
jgi:hypothetical protein